MKAGYYPKMTMAEYIGDPCEEPSLSTGSVCDLTERSAKVAHLHHPRLGKQPQDRSPRGELGSAIHAGIVGGHELAYCDALNPRDEIATDWKTKAAQQFWDDAVKAGKIPLLEKQRTVVDRAVSAALEALGKHQERRCEETMLFQHEGAWFRGRPDLLTAEWDIDIKTSENAEPVTWAKRTIQAGGLDIQAAIRNLGHKVLGQPRKQLWLVVEIEGAFDCSFVAPDGEMLDNAQRKIDHAAKTWRKCLDNDIWPGYSRAITYASTPAYALWDAASRGIQ